MPGGGAPAGGDASGKADYTAQWIAYYRANGMNKEADAIEQSLKARVGNENEAGGGHENVAPAHELEQPLSDSSSSSRSSGFFSDHIYQNM